MATSTATIDDDISIDTDRLINSKVQDEYVCPICRSLLWKPVCCKGCKTIFCKKCIREWLLQKDCKNRCPMNCKKYQEESPPPILNSLLSKLELKCCYKTFGCQETILYESIERHENECDYQTKQCRGCENKFLLKDIRQHEEYCDKIDIHCDLCQ
ncbi:unnamed protein product [Didymodactylos carnosus]|nr:unnamed protein product [Didymodactylos carnosus]CAF3951263.1 unnamed protein product [Didymodactylos carnosus]